MNVILIAHEKPLWGTDARGERAEIGVTFDVCDTSRPRTLADMDDEVPF